MLRIGAVIAISGVLDVVAVKGISCGLASCWVFRGRVAAIAAYVGVSHAVDGEGVAYPCVVVGISIIMSSSSSVRLVLLLLESL